MTPVTCFRGRSVALFGLGGSGLATAQALAAGGAQVAAWDDKPTSRGQAVEACVPVVDLAEADWSGFSALVLSPGVPLTHPVPHWTVEKARAAGVEIIGDVELFCRERAATAPDAPFIAITGTNGKSTTTALIAHLVREAGLDCQMGGNIGTAVLSLAPPAAGRVHVVECSSFQIDLAPSLAPTVGVLLNITPDHLDRHGTMENYAAIKERLVAGAEVAVIGVDDDWCRAIEARLRSAGRRVIPISVERVLEEGISAEDHIIARRLAGKRIVLADLAGIGSLRGAHNAQNAAAAIAALETIGVDEKVIRKGLASFPGLAHRMEQVRRIGRTLFVNDSKATNADAAEKALAAFPSDIHWIIGGVPKEGGIAPLAPLFGRVAKAYLIGKASDDFAATLEGRTAYTRCGALEAAVAAAAADAAASDAAEPVVLLSPACASYDQYPNFEVRGTHFRDLVLALPETLSTHASPPGKA
ncbi:UDP-N-acetylmuramoyl-L-alanine--D-glutamate ligase [Alsobacter sp. SYSU BS001988]